MFCPKAALHHLSRHPGGHLGNVSILSNTHRMRLTISHSKYALLTNLSWRSGLFESKRSLGEYTWILQCVDDVTKHTMNTVGEYIIARIPSARMSTLQGVAGTALYLSSRAGVYTNGTTITLNGGKTNSFCHVLPFS